MFKFFANKDGTIGNLSISINHVLDGYPEKNYLPYNTQFATSYSKSCGLVHIGAVEYMKDYSLNSFKKHYLSSAFFLEYSGWGEKDEYGTDYMQELSCITESHPLPIKVFFTENFSTYFEPKNTARPYICKEAIDYLSKFSYLGSKAKNYTLELRPGISHVGYEIIFFSSYEEAEKFEADNSIAKCNKAWDTAIEAAKIQAKKLEEAQKKEDAARDRFLSRFNK